jgi:UDP-N-acetylglucosamine diphosphorylase/glucosamine-1-phosphate N-acetyltransferase
MINQIVILAGGKSSRFYPFNLIHKGLFTVAGKTILQRTIGNILEKFNSEIIIVLSKKNFEFERKIIEEFGFKKKLIFVEQKESLGMAGAILSAKEHLDDNFFVVNSQQSDISEYSDLFAKKLHEEKALAVVGCQKTDTPSNYGILEFENGKPSGVVEKPQKGDEPSDQRVVGIYLFNKEFISELEKTPISQYSLEETLARIAKSGHLSSVEIKNKLLSLKYPWDLFAVKDSFLSEIKRSIDESAEVSETAIIRGDVYIGKGAKVYDYSIIDGPAYIGENAVVGAFSQIRGGTILEKGSKIQRYVDIKNSILGENSSVHSGFIGDSIISKNVKIGAGFTVANKRLDRKNINVVVNGKKVDTGLNKLGVLIGENSSLGINVSAMPGSVLNSKSLVYPQELVKGTK